MTTPPRSLSVLVGSAALGFSVIYFVSDLVELAQDGFSTWQLVLTYVAEAAIPLFVLGLYAVQRPQIGRLGLAGAIAYAYAFTYFTGTVLIALVDKPDDFSTLQDRLGAWLVVHGAVMVFAGAAFGAATVRSGVLPAWTGVVLIIGVVLVAATTELPEILQTISAGVRDLGFAAMGYAVLVRDRRRTAHGTDVQR
jgi:Ca2+/Na+ antiporter